jgi:hypothetical protein
LEPPWPNSWELVFGHESWTPQRGADRHEQRAEDDKSSTIGKGINKRETGTPEYPDLLREEWKTKVLPALRKFAVRVLVRLTNKFPFNIEKNTGGPQPTTRKKSEFCWNQSCANRSALAKFGSAVGKLLANLLLEGTEGASLCKPLSLNIAYCINFDLQWSGFFSYYVVYDVSHTIRLKAVAHDIRCKSSDYFSLARPRRFLGNNCSSCKEIDPQGVQYLPALPCPPYDNGFCSTV